ncbi:MAG TPA: tetratricopeptide repeat protein [Verrucomicrobiae bacterium]|nr:tetratricopeptide repeat protein [Verrucomicrobiae bacterium]
MPDFRRLNLAALAAAFTLLIACAHKETYEEHQQKELADSLRKAEAGDTQAMYQVASAYESGSGAPQDYAKAMEWYRKAAGKGDGSAMFNIGEMYRQGRGVPKDMEQTVAWYLKASNAGESIAWYNLGMMYYKGDEIPRNDAEAMRWLQKYAAAITSSSPLYKPTQDAIADIQARK